MTLRATIAITAPLATNGASNRSKRLQLATLGLPPRILKKLRPCALFAKQSTPTNEAHNNPQDAPPIHATLQANQAP